MFWQGRHCGIDKQLTPHWMLFWTSRMVSGFSRSSSESRWSIYLLCKIFWGTHKKVFVQFQFKRIVKYSPRYEINLEMHFDFTSFVFSYLLARLDWLFKFLRCLLVNFSNHLSRTGAVSVPVGTLLFRLLLLREIIHHYRTLFYDW